MQAGGWCDGQAASRLWPEDDRFTVSQAFELERASLLALPEHDYPVLERLEVQVGKTPYVRFDLNDYSITHTHVRRTLTVVADPERVRILMGAAVLATRPRSYDRGAQIELEVHIQELVDRKRGARQHRATDRLAQAVPAVPELLKRAAARGYSLGAITSALAKLLDRYGAQPMQAGVTDALARDVPHPNAVLLALERARELHQQSPPVATQLSERARRLDVMVRPHALNSCDELRPNTGADPETDHPTNNDKDTP